MNSLLAYLPFLSWLSMPVMPDCIMTCTHSAYFAIGTSPVTVTLPLATETDAPVQPAFLRSSVIFPVSAGSGAAGVATGTGFNVVLLTTDFTPSTVLAVSSAFFLAAASATSPVRVATPSLTATVTPVTPAAASFSVTPFCTSASLLPQALTKSAIAIVKTVMNLIFIFPPQLLIKSCSLSHTLPRVFAVKCLLPKNIGTSARHISDQVILTDSKPFFNWIRSTASTGLATNARMDAFQFQEALQTNIRDS